MTEMPDDVRRLAISTAAEIREWCGLEKFKEEGIAGRIFSVMQVVWQRAQEEKDGKSNSRPGN